MQTPLKPDSSAVDDSWGDVYHWGPNAYFVELRLQGGPLDGIRENCHALVDPDVEILSGDFVHIEFGVSPDVCFGIARYKPEHGTRRGTAGKFCKRGSPEEIIVLGSVSFCRREISSGYVRMAAVVGWIKSAKSISLAA